MLSRTPELMRLEVKPRKMVQPEAAPPAPPNSARLRSAALSGSILAEICEDGPGKGDGGR